MARPARPRIGRTGIALIAGELIVFGVLITTDPGEARWRLGVAGATVVALTFLMIVGLRRSLRADAEDVSTMATQLARGASTLAPATDPVLAPVVRTSGRMARLVAEQAARLSSQGSILESMQSGVIALDREHRIITVNGAARAVLGFTGEPDRGRLLEEVVREPRLHQLAIRAMTEPRVHETFELVRQEATGTPTTVELISAPLVDAAGARTGVLLTFNDVTQLRRLEGLRRDFAANVSHELRTPVTSIKGYVETLLEIEDAPADKRELTRPQARQFLEIVRASATRLEAIIEDLLALARLEERDASSHLPSEHVNVAGLVDGVLRSCAEAAAPRQITLTADIDPAIEVLGVARLLEQALLNLLSNAVKYSFDATPVTVTAERWAEEAGEMIAISVIDRGPGIARPHLDRLFERFYRVDQARSRAMGGTGLGLAIVKHIAIVHGGRAEVESEVGAGSTFRILVPSATPRPQPGP